MTIDEHDVNEADDVGRQETATEPPPRRWRFTRRMTRYIAAAVAVAVAGGALAVYRISRDDAATSGGRAITAAELERTYGTRIDLVALTALGGLVQLRFTVLDAAKAEPLFHLAENMPALEAESSGAILHAPTGMRHHLTLLDGGSYFVLYANAGNALSPGAQVSVLIDDVKLEHLVTAS